MQKKPDGQEASEAVVGPTASEADTAIWLLLQTLLGAAKKLARYVITLGKATSLAFGLCLADQAFPLRAEPTLFGN